MLAPCSNVPSSPFIICNAWFLLLTGLTHQPVDVKTKPCEPGDSVFCLLCPKSIISDERWVADADAVLKKCPLKTKCSTACRLHRIRKAAPPEAKKTKTKTHKWVIFIRYSELLHVAETLNLQKPLNLSSGGVRGQPMLQTAPQS